MKLDEATSAVLGCSISGYYKWKKEGRLIIKLLEKYMTKGDLLEFIEHERIKKLEVIDSLASEIDHINNEFFFESYSRKPRNRDFTEFVFPAFSKYINQKNDEYKNQTITSQYRVTIGSIKLDLTNCIINMDNIHVEEYLDSKNITSDINSYKSQIIQVYSQLQDFELYLLFNSYKEFIQKHEELFQ